MPLDLDRYREFTGLLNDPQYREVQCGDFLIEASNYLTKETAVRINQVVRESRAHYGSSDFIIFYDCKGPYGRIEQCAVIWEIKAPQCFLMERDDNNNRCRPTQDLVKAENQLVHYYHEISNSDDFRRRYRINNPANIKLGGLIIGRDHAIMNLTRNPDMKAAAENSFEIRTMQIYDKCNFRIHTWDRIAEYLAPENSGAV